MFTLGWAQWNLSRFEYKFGDTRLSDKINPIKNFQLDQSYSYVNRKVWYHQIWISKQLRFHCAHPKLYILWERSSIFKVLLNSYIPKYFLQVLTNLHSFLIWVFALYFNFISNSLFIQNQTMIGDCSKFSVLQKKTFYLEVFFVKSSKTNHFQKSTFKKLQVFLGFIFCKIYFYTKARNFLHFL